MKLRHDLSPVLLFVWVVTAHVYPADWLLGADSVTNSVSSTVGRANMPGFDAHFAIVQHGGGPNLLRRWDCSAWKTSVFSDFTAETTCRFMTRNIQCEPKKKQKYLGYTQRTELIEGNFKGNNFPNYKILLDITPTIILLISLYLCRCNTLGNLYGGNCKDGCSRLSLRRVFF